MNAFYEHHEHSIRARYRCFDRILLNGLIQPFQQPERVIGFFSFYRKLFPVTRKVLTGIADQFQNWLMSRSEKWGAPILDAPPGRRDEFIEPYFRHAKPDQVVAIVKAREPARIMTAIVTAQENRWHLQIAQRWVVQYNFYVNDSRWGRMFVRMCPYLPFSARVCLNQHHWLANRLREENIDFGKSSNAFLRCGNFERLQQLADSLTVRDLLTCGQKWLTAFTPFIQQQERKQAGCQHRLFFAQVEYCDNLIFHRRAALDALGERLLDANRTIGQPDKITVIFGRKITSRHRGKLQTEIEDMHLPNPVIRSHYANGFIKQIRSRPPDAAHRGGDQQRQRLWSEESGGEPSPTAPEARGDQRQLSEHPTRHSGNLHRPGTITPTRPAHHPAQRQAHPGPETGSPSPTGPHARLGTLCTRGRRINVHHCGNPSLRGGGTGRFHL